MRLGKLIKHSVVLALVAGLFSPISAANATAACNPTFSTGGNYGAIRNYDFKTAGTCTWTVPAGMVITDVLLLGGGGGGGGGSWSGSTTGAGGGGGGAGGYKRARTLNYLSLGTTYNITIGSGGAAGSGAASQGGNGSNGGDGTSTSFGSLFQVTGGSGGVGGNGDTGGAGGASGTNQFGSSTNPGGADNSGNGGGGASSLSNISGYSASSSQAGLSKFGASVDVNTYLLTGGTYFSSGGSGGASAGSSANGGGTGWGAPATPTANQGSGGGGGHGCVQSDSSCANRSGTAGADGRIIIVVKWELSYGDNPGTMGSFRVGAPVNFRPFFAPEPKGTGTWSSDFTLPAGLTLNSTTGIITGTPTAISGGVKEYYFTYTDSDQPLMAIKASRYLAVYPGTQRFIHSDFNLEYGKSYRIPIEQFSGNGTFTITSSSSRCQLSGPHNETVTSTSSSGSCNIYIQNTGDSNWYTYYEHNVVTLTKINTAVTLSTTPASPRVTNTAVTLTANLTSGATGLVEFYAGATLITNCGTAGQVTISNAQASCTWTPTSASGSPFSLTAKYLGATNYAPATSAGVDYTIYPSIALSYAGGSTTYSNAITLSPTVSGGTGSISNWTWSVKKTSDNSSVSGITINSSGVISVSNTVSAATYDMTVQAVDTVGITASATLRILVSPTTPTVNLNQPARSELTKGQSLTLSASLPVGATGTITFKYGTTTITGCGSAGAVTISAGSASCTWATSSAAAGLYDVTAVYSGDGSYTGTTSFALKIKLNAQASYTYADQSVDYFLGTTVAPQITTDTGSGNPNSWTWSVVKNSDSSSVSEITINSVGLVSVASTIGAGSYPMRVTAIDGQGDTTTATFTLTVNKVRPVLTISPRMTSGALSPEATVNRQLYWKVETTHRSASLLTLYINGTSTSCPFFSIAYSDGQCWWSPTNAGTTISAYVTFPGDSNLETATSNVITGFQVNPALTLSYSDTSTYAGFSTEISPVFSGGTGTKQFGISQYFTGYQVHGITIDSATGVISVSRSTVVGNYRMVASVTDQAFANTYYNDLYISVLDQATPLVSLSYSAETVTVNSALRGYRLIHSSTPGTFYSISPTLPSGLKFSSTSGEISGTPTQTLNDTDYTITAKNNAGEQSVVYRIRVASPSSSGITLSLSTTAAKGVLNSIIATLSTPGKVQFLLNNKRIPGCISVSGTTTATCSWKPTGIGSFRITAKLVPTDTAIPLAIANPLQVSVGRRTGLRA